jgi:hypothetical protein
MPLEAPSWNFDANGPVYQISHAGTWVKERAVDPAPCYGHDPELVRAELAHLQAVAPLPYPLAIVLLRHEVTSRTNGDYTTDHGYRDPEYLKAEAASKDHVPAPRVGIIVLSGKRIPIHPAMTRYLVAHEYGHSVEDRLAELSGFKNDQQLLTEYVKDVRPEATGSYGCGKWHQNRGELFANDFRILIAKREVEFWPHPGFPHPLQHPRAIRFWEQAIQVLRGNE